MGRMRSVRGMLRDYRSVSIFRHDKSEKVFANLDVSIRCQPRRDGFTANVRGIDIAGRISCPRFSAERLSSGQRSQRSSK